MNSIKARLIVVIVGVAFFTTLCVGGLFVKNMVQNSEEAVKVYRQELTANVERELRLETETALSVIKQVYERQQAGQLTPEQAKRKRPTWCARCVMTMARAIFGWIPMRASMSSCWDVIVRENRA